MDGPHDVEFCAPKSLVVLEGRGIIGPGWHEGTQLVPVSTNMATAQVQSNIEPIWRRQWPLPNGNTEEI